MSFQKHLFVVLVYAVIFTVVMAGTAFAETEYCPDCGQELNIVDSVESDCDYDGYILYECSNCDYSIEVTLPALGHDYSLSYQGEATCTESAWKEYTCSRCGDWYSEEEGEPLGHDYEATAHEDATCTQTGWTEYTCTRCGDCYYENEGEPLGHQYEATEQVEATCTESAWTLYTCSRCGDSYSEDEGEPLGHDYEATEHEDATCMYAGWTLYTCSRCGDYYYEDEGEPLGHQYEATEHEEATCTEAGWTEYTCSRCGDYYYENEGEPLGHHYEATEYGSPTCTDTGWVRYTCSYCGDYYDEEEGAPLGHNWVFARNEGNPVIGWEVVYSCSRCDEEDWRSNEPPHPEGTMYVVLTWGADPSDLDSHLMCLDQNSEIAYYNMNNPVASLDTDDTTSYGPEVTTIFGPINGCYSFFVHDFTNQDNNMSTALANSGCVVQVYTDSTLRRTFHVPSSLIGDRWDVFYYDASTDTITEYSEKGLDLDINSYPIIVKVNQRDPGNINEKMVLAEGAEVAVGGMTYTTDQHGSVNIPLTGSVTVSKEGYITRTLTVQQLVQNNEICLQKAVAPAIIAVWYRESGGKEIDLLREKAYFNSDATLQIFPEVYWGDGSEKHLYIYQNGAQEELYISPDGSVTFDPSSYDIRDKIHIVAKNNEGLRCTRELKLQIASAIPDSLSGLSIKLDGNLSFTLPESTGILKNLKMSVNLFTALPVQTQFEDGRFYVAIGMAEGYENGQDTGITPKSWAKSIQKIKDSYSAESLKKLRKQLGKKTADLKGSVGFECSLSVMAYAEGYVDPDGHLVVTDCGGFILGKGEVSYTQPFFWGPVPMFFELSFSNDLQAGLNFALANGEKEFAVSAEIVNTTKLSGGLGIGVSKAASLSGGVKGSLINTLNFEQGSLSYYRLSAELEWYFKVKALFFNFTYTDTIAKATWYEWPEPGRKSAGFEPHYFSQDQMYDSANYQPDDLSYLKRGNVASLNTDGITNVYEAASPQLLYYEDGCGLLVWLDYNSEADPGPDALNLFYSWYDGASWSDPALIENDGSLDACPVLTMADGTAWLIWLNAESPMTEEDTLDSAGTKLGVRAASFDRNTLSFAAETISPSSGLIQMEPTLCAYGDELYAVWLQNNSGSWFGSEGINGIYYSRYEEGNWSAPILLCSATGPVTSLSADCSDGTLRAAYSVDLNRDLSDSGDMEIFCNGVQVTSNDRMDSGVCFSEGQLFWFSEGHIYADGEVILPENSLLFSDRFQIISSDGNKALITGESYELGTILHAMIYDPVSETWSSPTSLSDGSASIPCFSAAFSDTGELKIIEVTQPVVNTVDSGDPYGECSLEWMSIPLYFDVEVRDASLDWSDYADKEAVMLEIDLFNKGLIPTERLSVKLIDENEEVIVSRIVEQRILSGESEAITLFIPIDRTWIGKQTVLYLSTEQFADVNLNDNSVPLPITWDDVAVENLHIGLTDDEDCLLFASIANYSLEEQHNVKIDLRQATADAEIVDTITVSSIDALSMICISFDLGTEPEGSYYVSLNSDRIDSRPENDVQFIVIRPTDDVGEFIVTFDGNGGVGSMAAQTFYANIFDTLTPNAFTCEGYAFVGWNTESDGSGILYSDGESVMLTEDLTLYAQWYKLLTIGYSSKEICKGETYHFTAEGGSGNYSWRVGNPTVATVDAEGTVTGVSAGNTYLYCTDSEDNEVKCLLKITVPSLSIHYTNKTITAGDSFQFTAEGGIAPYTWRTGNSATAIVNAAGKVTGVAAGNTYLYCKDSSGTEVKCLLKITVEPLSIRYSEKTVNVGVPFQFTATGGTGGYTWRVGDATKATVDAIGKVTGKTAGNTYLYCKDSAGTEVKCLLKITAAPLSIHYSEKTVKVSEDFQFTATGGTGSYTWRVGNAATATVDTTGKVTGKAAGNTYLYCKDSSGTEVKCLLKITVEPLSIRYSEKTINVGASFQFVATGGTGGYTWRTGNASVATVDATGKVTGKAVGNTYLYCQDSAGKEAKCLLKITAAPPSIRYAEKTVTVGVPFQFTATGGAGGYTWRVGDTAKATVDSSGKVTGKAAGNTYLYCKDSAGTEVKCLLKVVVPPSIRYSEKTISVGASFQFEATGGTGDYTWRVGNASVATVDATGKVTGKAVGNTYLYCRDDLGNEVKCLLKIK